jgi:hypothetical protein
MPHRIAGSILVVLLVAVSCAFCWYGVSTNRLAVKDTVFLKGHFTLLQPFASAWLFRGSLSYYLDLDPQAAAADYRQAIARQPLMIEAWLNLAKAELAAGREGETRRILKTLSPFISHVSTWKWQEFLLARDLRDETLFASIFNFILTRLPTRAKEASFVARSFWGGSLAVLPHLVGPSQYRFFNELMEAKDSETALALWRNMESSATPPGRVLRLEFCQFLLEYGKVTDAKEIWASWRDDGGQTVYDCGFELKPTNTGFGWKLLRTSDVLIERSVENPFEGKHSLHLRFLGLKNVAFNNVYQLTPVTPGKDYRLSFAFKSQGLSTDQGVFLEVSGYQCKGLNVQTKPVLGTTPWSKEEVTVSVPEGCEAAYLIVRRKESLMFDSKISGDYWLDVLELAEKHAQ